ISGAHFNPLITLHMGLQGVMPWREVPAYVLAQLSGGVIGVACANAMFGLPLLAVSQHSRAGPGLLLGEAVATFGLLMIVWYGWQGHAPLLPVSVGAYIAAAIMFTSSTSFANPAVTIARSLSDSFAGIAPHHVFAFVLAQLAGALAAVAVAGWLAKRTEQ
ncbi:MAG TPA: aquaporin, partial [Candidatus Eremiobacteraceae bacterium]|nr:aquaporin [Candidatus Eremiobacteraceae bacterium]